MFVNLVFSNIFIVLPLFSVCTFSKFVLMSVFLWSWFIRCLVYVELTFDMFFCSKCSLNRVNSFLFDQYTVFYSHHIVVCIYQSSSFVEYKVNTAWSSVWYYVSHLLNKNSNSTSIDPYTKFTVYKLLMWWL